MAAKIRRPRYHRGSLQDAVGAALRMDTNSPLYIYGTAYGLTIDYTRPPFGQTHVIVTPTGEVRTVSRYN